MHSLAHPAPPTLARRAARFVHRTTAGLDAGAPFADLLVRLYLAQVFFASGLTKIASFETTILLFENEYRVPLLSPVLAAYLGTFVELFFPVLLAFGLGGRLAACVLFGFNIVAVVAYPDLNEAGIAQHTVWGLLLLVSLLHGPGKLSVDHVIARRFSTD